MKLQLNLVKTHNNPSPQFLKFYFNNILNQIYTKKKCIHEFKNLENFINKIIMMVYR